MALATPRRMWISSSVGAARLNSWFRRGMSFLGAAGSKKSTATKAVMKNFEELAAPHGGINCCQIARVNWMDRDQVKDFYGNPESRRQHCINVVGETAKSLGELLEKEAEYMAAKKAEHNQSK